ncbi:cupin domain-containing protein [Bacillus massilinigeriensis]|uniref:cupin domain-containing protein n=1 Tax=Bacillus massilionigeriensis TaxID=1805475 RepID=UPI00096B2125|nr:cupin domain-containing protein [Bacillus massilionigeriensis]
MKISQQNAEHYKWGDDCDGWHLVNNKDLSVIHERMPANTKEVLHYHQQSRQFFYVLAGNAIIDVDGERISLNPKEGIEVSPLTPHQMFNESDQEVEFLVISQPNSHIKSDRVIL